jgi:hypothetical protein
MLSFSGLALLVCACTVWGQTDDPALAAAQAEVERVRAGIEAGVAPRAQLAKAESALADAQDAAFLRKTAYGQDLDVDQAGEMIGAAQRRLERRQKAYDEARKLVDAGVATQLSLGSLIDDRDRARKELDLAESRARLTRELSEMAQAEELLANRSPEEAPEVGEQYTGDGAFAFATFAKVEVAFEDHFGRKLPVSAVGETAVHRALGFDHRGRVDVALNPDQPEGVWLLAYLKQAHIPFFAFRHAVPGKATGAHIHIGPVSTRLAAGG